MMKVNLNQLENYYNRDNGLEFRRQFKINRKITVKFSIIIIIIIMVSYVFRLISTFK